MRFSDRTFVVTGGAHGIGRAYCEGLAADGAQVVCLDIDGRRAEEVAAGIRARDGTAVAIEADVRELARCTDAARRAVALRERQTQTRSLKRVEHPADLVGTIAFLLSDDSEMITGQTIIVEGGSVFV